MEEQQGQANSYRVEVSGWDATENFFVEKTTLDWGDGEKKEIRVGHALREEAVVFVRLLQPFPASGNFPIAYRAKRVAVLSTDGESLICLTQLRPNGRLACGTNASPALTVA